MQAIAVNLRPIDVLSALHLAARFGICAYDVYVYFLECAPNVRPPILTLDKQIRRVAGELSIPVLE